MFETCLKQWPPRVCANLGHQKREREDEEHNSGGNEREKEKERHQKVAHTNVPHAVARARGGVVPTPGITVIGPPGAAAAAVMPGVRRTPGLPRGRDARGHAYSIYLY